MCKVLSMGVLQHKQGLVTVLQESTLMLQWFVNGMWLYSFKLLQERQEPCWAVFENDYSLDDA